MSVLLLFYDACGFCNPFQSPSAPNLRQFYLRVHYADAQVLAKEIKQAELHLLSAAGSISADARTNTVYIHDDFAHLAQIRGFISQFDRPLPQILIKARIVALDDHAYQTLGLHFFSSQENAVNFSPDLPPSTANRITIPLVKFANNNLLNLQLNALEQEGRAVLISSPELITVNNHSALIQSGEEIPYEESTASGATSVTFKKAVLQLKVRPFILPMNKLRLEITVNQDKVSSLSVKGVPAITTEELNTIANVGNGQTLILGGIFEEMDSNQRLGLPGIMHIPIFGGIFSEHHVQKQRRQLLIFITPIIVSDLHE